MKKATIFSVGFLAIALIFSPITGSAKSDSGKKNGVPHQLKKILAELEEISAALEGASSAEFYCEDCATVKGAAQQNGLVAEPEVGSYDLVNLTGPGKFIAGRLVKQGGSTGLTAVELEIDGQIVVSRNVEALKNWGMSQANPFGVVVLSNPDFFIDTVTIGFSQPLAYQDSLVLRAVVNEDDVVQLIGTVIYGQ